MARIIITKRISLAGLAEGWDDCYAIVAPATYQDYDALTQLDFTKLTQNDLIKIQMDIVKDHLLTGEIKEYGKETLSKLLPDDVYSSLDLTNRLYAEIMGIKLDPKGSSAAAESAPKQPSLEGTTETSSSTELQETSPSQSSDESISSGTESTSDSPA